MCGIFGYTGHKNNAADIILEGLKRLEYRGYDSWGIGVKDHHHITIDKHTGKIGSATTDLPASNIGCGHTRWATHGGVTDANAHPHRDCTKKIALMHNGIVENYLSIKNHLLRQDHHFHSETDTEVIVHLIEEIMKTVHDPLEATRQAFLQLEGRNAIVVLFAEFECIIAAKNGSPLVIGIGDHEHFLASDAAALLPHTKQVMYMDDDLIAQLSADNLQIASLNDSKPVSPTFQTLTWAMEDAQKGPYKHFLLKEIMEQGKTIEQAAMQNETQLFSFAEAIKQAFGMYLVGCGTAGHACRAATYIFSMIAKKHSNFCVGSEFSYFDDFLTEKSLLIAVSQSGETADILEAVKAAKLHGSSIAALVNAPGSSLERVADFALPLRAGPEKAVLSTKAFTAKMTIFFLLADILADQYKEGKKLLLETADAVNSYLENPELCRQIEKISDSLYTKHNIYILGRGLSYPIALEAAHKIKESSYIHAEGFAGGEPKHCEISLISDGTPSIIFVPNDETTTAILSNAMEFKSRGAYIIGISPIHHAVFDEWIEVPDLGITSSLVNVIPAQILAYYLAVKRGNDPDKPRNLAKSVTVK